MKKILASLLTVFVLMSVCVIHAGAEIQDPFTEKDGIYKDSILPKIARTHGRPEHVCSYGYEELYYCTADEAEAAEYVLVFATVDGGGPAYSCGVFGDYVVTNSSCFNPYELGYYIYVPAEDKLYTLREAWNKNIENLEKVFTEDIIGDLVGDMDRDNKLTVKDSTIIQKRIAGIITNYGFDVLIGGVYEDETVKLDRLDDFNRDRKCDIKDATAIQKHIAGLAY